MKTINKLWIAIFISGFLFLACSNKDASETSTGNELASGENTKSDGEGIGKRYGIKSGIVTSETMLPNNMGKTTTVQYFDDYGTLDYTESTTEVSAYGTNSKTISNSIIKDDVIYNWEPGSKTGTKILMDKQMDVSKINYRELSEDLKKQFNIKEEGKENVNGKNCDVYSMDYMGAKGKIFIWEGITMKSDIVMMGMNVVINVVKLEENAKIASDKFTIPVDITFTEVSMPIGK